MSKHTKGPWRVIIDDTGGSFTGWPSVSASESLDCSIVHRAGFKQEYWGDLSRREAIANARLIAAAPELLEMVIDLLDALGEGDSEIENDARAVIVKATGVKHEE